MHKKFIMFISLLLLVLIPMSFAADDELGVPGGDIDLTGSSINDIDALKATNDYYFNASAEDDGDGSFENPYKYLTADRIKANANIYLADGEYELDAHKNIEKVNIYGSNVDKTIITYSGVGFTVSSFLTVENVTFNDMSITNRGNVSANNTVFAYGSGSAHDSYGNNFGGAIYVPGDYSNAHVTVNNCTFYDNFAVYGGAIYMGSGYLEVIDTLFNLNRAYNFGGAIACENTKSISISKSRFYNSRSIGDAGGAIYLRGTDFSARSIEIVNSSATFGSAITSLETNVLLAGVTCQNNTAKWDGGAIYHMYGNFSLTGSKFNNNSARNGGALYIDNSTYCYLISNTFNYNNASHTAGAVYSILNKLKNPLQAKNYYNGNHAYYMNDIFDNSQINLNIGDGNYTMYKANPQDIDVLPAYYSLIDECHVSSIKDQETGGNCWAFSILAVIESAILKINGDSLDLSEENMKNLMALYSDYGWPVETNEGGNDYMTWAYLTSWLGPILESDDLTDDKSALSPVINSILHVQNILFLKRDNFTDNDAIKKALMMYGAVDTGMAYYSNYINYDSYYCYSTMTPNHAVTIVGWDDNYSKNNFKWAGSIGDGAWIVKNSWGSDWLENGYFYVSYYDMNFAKPGSNDASFVVIFNDTIKYDKNYQYDIPGMTDYFLNETSYVWYKNVFKADGDEYLAAVSTYFEKTTNWTVSIYVDDDVVHVQEGMSVPGYFTIDLDQMVPLKSGDVFEVVFNIHVDGEAAFPISEKISLNRLFYAPEVSYVSYDGDNWQDLYDLSWSYSSHIYYSQVACIKAFTVFNEIGTNLNLSVAFDGNPSDITAIVYNQYGNLLRNGVVTFTVNDADYVVDVKDGIAKFPYNFSKVFNSILAKFEKVGYISSSNQTSLSIEKSGLDIEFEINRTLNNVTVNIHAGDKINNDATLFVNGDMYPIRFFDGKCCLNLNNLKNGIYNLTLNLSFSEDSIYSGCAVNGSFTIDMKNTTITADDLIVTDEDNVTYVISLFDDANNPLIGKTLDVIIGGNVFRPTTDINGQASVSFRLNPGAYTADIRFGGEDDYFSSALFSNIKVKSKVLIDLDIERFANNVSLSINVSKHINGTINVIINNRTQILDVNDGVALMKMDNLDNGIYYVNVRLNETLYDFDDVSASFAVDVKNTRIIADDVVVNNKDSFNYTVVLLDELNNTLSNKSIEIVLAGNTYDVLTNGDGEAVLPIMLIPGIYNPTIKFKGDNDYFESASTSIIDVKSKIDVDLTVDKYANEVVFTVRLSIKAMGFLTLTVNDESKSLKFVNGAVRYKMSDLKNGQYDVSIKLDNPIYVYDDVSASFTVDVRNTQILADDLAVCEDDLINYTLCLVDEDGNPLSKKSMAADLNGLHYDLITDENGTAIICINLKSGVYSLSVSFGGDDNYIRSSNSSLITVKARVNVDLDVEKYANNATLTVNISRPINETIILKINDEIHEIDVVGGIGFKELSDLDNGIYTVNVGLDESVYDFNNVSAKFVVNVSKTRIEANDLIITDIDGGTFNVSLVDENSNPISNRSVKFKLNGIEYVKTTDENGRAMIEFDLKHGLYDVYVIFDGDHSYFSSQSSNKIKIRAKVNISLSYDTMLEYYVIRFDSSNPMNETVNVKVNDDTYSLHIAGPVNTLVLDNLSDGVYDVFISLNDTDDFSFDNITSQFVIDTKESRIISQDLIAYHNHKTIYSVKLTDEEGNPIVNGSVYLNLNNAQYFGKTDANGDAEFEFELPMGEYNVTVSYLGLKYSYYGSNSTQIISVKTTIIPSENLTKTYNSKYEVKFLDSLGNPLKESNVTLILNSVKYDKITDSSGFAYLDILEKPGSYELTIINPNNIENITKTIDVVARIAQNHDLNIYAFSAKAFKVRIFDDNGNPVGKDVEVTIKIAGETYIIKTDDDGYASYKISLPANEYSIVASYNGFEVSNNVKVKPVLITYNKIFKKSKSYKFKAKLLDTNGKPLKGKRILFIFKGKKFSAKTNNNGIATLTIKLKLKVSYNVIYSYYGKSKRINWIKIIK